MTDIKIDPDALARETLELSNEAAWSAMGARLATRGIKRPGEIRDAAWAIRRRLLKEAALRSAAAFTPPSGRPSLPFFATCEKMPSP